jgi:antitoxin PrlF
MQITANGQVSIPPEIQQQLGLLPGTEIEIAVIGDTLQLKKKPEPNRGNHLISLMQGKASVKLTTDEIMALTRSEQ